MSYLAIMLEEPPVFGVHQIDSPFRLGSFFEIPVKGETGLFLGFYDWLRSSAGEVIGLRITFHDQREPAIQSLRQSQIGEWEAPEIFRMLFLPGIQVCENLSVDQNFSVSRVYMGPGGQVALLVDMEGVEDELHEQLRRSGAGR